LLSSDEVVREDDEMMWREVEVVEGKKKDEN
jgi:hypothetical protein